MKITSSFMKVNGSFTWGFNLCSTQTQSSHLYRILDLEEVEECPDEADDEGGDDDEEEEVVVPEPKEISTSVDCLSWGSARHTDDPKNLERGESKLQNSKLHYKQKAVCTAQVLESNC